MRFNLRAKSQGWRHLSKMGPIEEAKKSADTISTNSIPASAMQNQQALSIAFETFMARRGARVKTPDSRSTQHVECLCLLRLVCLCETSTGCAKADTTRQHNITTRRLNLSADRFLEHADRYAQMLIYASAQQGAKHDLVIHACALVVCMPQ